MRNHFRLLLIGGLLFLTAGCAGVKSASRARARNLEGVRATYCHAPRDANRRVDTPRLLAELKELHANTYSFCIHPAATDWEDLKLFLPQARAQGIRVWASLLPPSESLPRGKMSSEPFRLDYERWAVELARLSLAEPNLVAWSIDDFTHNLTFYTPDYLGRCLAAARAINPKLAFVPCCYYPGVTERFVANYGPLLDGILFPYRHESAGANLKDPSLVETEVNALRERAGGKIPIILDIYATAHSRLGATTPEYVETAILAGKKAAAGVMIYCHQDPRQDAAKYQAIKRQFAPSR